MKKFIFITGLLMSIFFYSCKEEDHGILPPIEGGGTIVSYTHKHLPLRESFSSRYSMLDRAFWLNNLYH